MPKSILTFAKVLAAEHARIEEIAARAPAPEHPNPTADQSEPRTIERILPDVREFFRDQLELVFNWARSLLAPLQKRGMFSSVQPAEEPEITTDDPRQLGAALQTAHNTPHAALCLSGGGIRSATFNLGILQGLGRHGLLNKFHYLSTVSGGGFIGSWFSAWTHRSRMGDGSAIEDISSIHSKAGSTDPVHPDPAPVRNLRRFSNYLSPRLGFFSADAWTLASIYVRNVLLNAMVLVPFLLAALMAPRIVYSLMNLDASSIRFFVFGSDSVAALLLIAGMTGGIMGIVFVGLNLPSIRIKNSDEAAYLKYCLTPLVVSALSLSTLWNWFLQNTSKPESAWLPSFALVRSWVDNSTFSIALTLVLILVPWIICAVWLRLKNHPVTAAATLFCTILLAVAGYATAYILLIATRNVASVDPRIFTTFSAPFFLGAMMMGGTLISGVTSRLTSDQDEEWWARSGAWLQIVLIGWIVLCGIVLWIPQFVLEFLQALLEDPGAAFSTWSNTISAIAGVGGALATALSLLGGFSSKTPALSGKPDSKGLLSSGTATNILAFGALVFVFSTLAAATGPILSLGAQSRTLDHTVVLAQTGVFLAVKATAGLLVFGYVMGVLIDTNKYSLHYFWRNRITRAYLGASRNPKSGKSDTSVAFTGFDKNDNIYMSALADQLPLHVVNIALNLTGSKRLEWQERKAETFTVSPLHCGNYRIGYRNSDEYGGTNGMSLGTAVAVSGAAASPNMGYMTTSASVRFLMTLFNVRLGWWLGNPGPEGDLTYQQRSPRHIIRPLLEEALGLTDEQAPYVYLSDGGHFDNLGLYEMVLRRCHWIVVSDASTDPDYSYESLAVCLRKIRIDLGISIQFDAPFGMGRFDDKGTYCATGVIHYSDIDDGAPDGRIIYIKPSLTGSEPADVRNYARSTAFPQEPISDQYFSESQFESYRALGAHIMETLTGIEDYKSLDDFFNVISSGREKPLAKAARAT